MAQVRIEKAERQRPDGSWAEFFEIFSLSDGGWHRDADHAFKSYADALKYVEAQGDELET